MKVKTRFGISGYNGNVDGMIYYTLPNSEAIIGRRKPEHFTESTHHNDYRLISQNIGLLQPSQEYKNDFKVYIALYKELPEASKKVSGWYNLYIAMLWNLQKSGSVDLKTLTKAQIYADNLPCKSVKAAVESGLLPTVLNYQNLDNGI